MYHFVKSCIGHWGMSWGLPSVFFIQFEICTRNLVLWIWFSVFIWISGFDFLFELLQDCHRSAYGSARNFAWWLALWYMVCGGWLMGIGNKMPVLMRESVGIWPWGKMVVNTFLWGFRLFRGFNSITCKSAFFLFLLLKIIVFSRWFSPTRCIGGGVLFQYVHRNAITTLL